MNKKKDVVDFFLDKEILVSSDFVNNIINDEIKREDVNTERLNELRSSNLLILDKNLIKIKNLKFSIIEFNRFKVFYEKNQNKVLFNKFIDSLLNIKEEKKIEIKKDPTPVNVLFSYEEESKKRTYDHFVSYYRARYNQIKNILIGRDELNNMLSVNKILSKKERETVSIIAMVTKKRITKNSNIILTVEDLTGSINVLINKNKAELYDKAQDISLDQVLAFQGVNGNNIIFINNILWPEIPLNKEFKKSPDETYAIFISDTELGSKFFLKDSFENFFKWISGEVGNKIQKEVASKVKYLFILGDLVDGVGVYPGQENDLIIPDIYEQYKSFANYLKNVPNDIKIIICPGNHDAMRIAEPQPPLYKDFAAPVWELKNVMMVSNPAYVNIHSSENFSGFDILMYHGYSLIPYSENVDSIRIAGGQERVDLTMKYLLKNRHLAPTHQSTLSLPTSDKDHLVIDRIPDFFVTGHVHRTSVSNYRNITLINASCWTGMTPNQEKRGLKPQPCRAIIANLQTRQIKIMNFDK